MTLNARHLQEAEPPWFALLCDQRGALEAVAELPVQGVTVRVLNANHMRSTTGLFSEVATQLDFPDYFGRNWDALEECLADLAWLPPGPYTIVIARASEFLNDGSRDERELFLRLVKNVASEWATPIRSGEAWDRPAVPFHLVFQDSPERCESVRMMARDAGVELENLELSSGHQRGPT
jgi:RNAse (barnase) inhibitor barstar